MIYKEQNALIREFDGETMRIEGYGKDGVRVRVTRRSAFTNENWALLPVEERPCEIRIGDKQALEEIVKANNTERISDHTAVFINGKLRVNVTKEGKLSFEREDSGKILLQEFEILQNSCLCIRSRELKAIGGDSYRASMKFQSDPKEKLFGMGQYQNGIYDLKGSNLELAQRNSQASVPFLFSDLGYGFLWNNPAIGRASFGKNLTEWEAESTKEIDFYITCGDTPGEILRNYMMVTGTPPMMPEYGLGFWQCKLRYWNQEQVLEVAREYKRRGVPLDVIVVDFFHWPLEGDWTFDPKYWPDPEKMVRELQEMGTELMVSVWPTVSVHSKNHAQMKERGLLVRTERGVRIDKLMIDPTSFADVTNPKARAYFWDKIKANYGQYGIRSYWLDVAEPGFSSYDFDIYNYYKGSALEVANEYPAMYAKTFYDGLKADGEEKPLTLIRCAWAGSQRYGALVWSGDIHSTFASFKNQIVCGLQMAMSGIPWWTTDIGGFAGGNIHDAEFKELLVRWFQYGTFCPVMRLHGNRLPGTPGVSNTGGGRCGSGADNEIWSFGEDNYEIFKRYIEIRERLRPYIRGLMEQTAISGDPVIRPLFYHFPKDMECFEVKDEYLFGSEILVAPVTEYGARERMVYLPSGENWINAFSKEVFAGGQRVCCPAPLEEIPLFIKEGSKVSI